jgi:hypothetical protein
LRVVVNEHDAAVQWCHFFNVRIANLFLGGEAMTVSQLWPPATDYSSVVS